MESNHRPQHYQGNGHPIHDQPQCKNLPADQELRHASVCVERASIGISRRPRRGAIAAQPRLSRVCLNRATAGVLRARSHLARVAMPETGLVQWRRLTGGSGTRPSSGYRATWERVNGSRYSARDASADQARDRLHSSITWNTNSAVRRPRSSTDISSWSGSWRQVGEGLSDQRPPLGREFVQGVLTRRLFGDHIACRDRAMQTGDPERSPSRRPPRT